MLKFNQTQWDALRVGETENYVDVVCGQFLANRPDMVKHPGRQVVRDRMRTAHAHAAAIGFTSASHVVVLMYLAADAAEIFVNPAINGHLRKPGATPEQRLDDLLAVMNKLGKDD